MVNEDNTLITERELLQAAASEGSDVLVRVLLDAGADVDGRNQDGRTALHLAANYGYASTVRLLAKAGANLEVTYGSTGYTALHRAARNGHLDAARVLLASGADPDIQTSQGRTALMLATSRKHEDMLRLLISFGADLNLAQTAVFDRDTVLHIAAYEDNPNIVRVLLKAGADPTILNDSGETPLVTAIYQEKHNVIEAFLVPGPSLAAIGPRRSDNVLNMCIYYEVESCVRKLLRFELPFSLDGQSNYNDRTPLTEAIYSNMYRAAISLVDHGADVNLISVDPVDGDPIDNGKTALMFAVSNLSNDPPSSLRVVKKLLNAGARINEQDEDDLTAIHYLTRQRVTSEGSVAILNVLIGAVQDANRLDYLNLRDENNKTPMQSAIDEARRSRPDHLVHENHQVEARALEY